jgi:hypothetical protein
VKASSKICVAKIAPSEANKTINLKESLSIVAGATCLAPVENDSTKN